MGSDISLDENIGSNLDESQWMKMIQQTRQTKYIGNDYELFIQYLSDPQTTHNDVISNITRVIRSYISKIASATLCDFSDTNYDFDGLKVSIAIHPINGDIYIADEHKVYKLLQKNALKLVAQIPEPLSPWGQKSRITDLSFHPDGDLLFCMLNNDLYSVYSIQYNNKDISIDSKINTSTRYDKMNVFKYDFTHYYLSNNDLKRIFPTLDFEATATYPQEPQSRVWSNGSIVKTNIYKKEVWILQNIQHHEPPIIHRLDLEENLNRIERITFDGNINLYALAFDVDKYFGAIYIITYDKRLYRCERIGDQDGKWRITHNILLRDVLENELPVGIHTIRYDSVIGRIIIADNYKLQALYL